MWQILINMCNCLWSRKKMYRIRCLTGLCVLQESIWKRSKYWNHQQQQSKRAFFPPFSFLSCVSRLSINGLIGQSKVSSHALPAPNYFSWWWMSSSTVTGLRRNSTAISSTSPCIVLFFFSGVSNLTCGPWKITFQPDSKKSWCSEIALELISFFSVQKTVVVKTEDMLGRNSSHALSIRMILRQNVRFISSKSPQFDVVVMENSFLLTLYEPLIQKKKQKTFFESIGLQNKKPECSWVSICSYKCSWNCCRTKVGFCLLCHHWTSKEGRGLVTHEWVVWLHWLTHTSLPDRSIPHHPGHTCYLRLNTISRCDVNFTNVQRKKTATATTDAKWDMK